MKISSKFLYYIVFATLIAFTGCSSPKRSGKSGQNTANAENTDELCSNGLDDNNNGYTDCADLDCLQNTTVTVCVGESESGTECHDGQDNDNDGLADCADPDCSAEGCFENTDEFCNDGEDNDGDSFADCLDFDCKNGCNITVCDAGEKSEAECSDGLDNDGDGHADCADYGCRECVAACEADLGENTVELCSDGLDNENDGAIDCQDTECVYLEELADTCDTGEENTEALCADGIDNDNDPYIDCADFNCSGIGACAENTEATCADGLDNDGDNYIDCDDWDCDSFLPCKEATNAQCSDLQDNDNDDDIDCDDLDCQENASICGGGTTSETSVAACTDETDNDSDGDIDCADSDCATLTICDTIIETTIEALRNPEHEDYDALEDNEQRLVRLSGVVVTSPLLQGSNDLYRFFVQEAFSPADTRFHGIEVFASDQTPEIQPGDTITLDGLYDDYFGRLSIVYQSHTLTSSGTAVTTTSVETQNLATAEQAKPYEGVLLELTSVKSTSNEEPLDPEENGWSEGDFWVVESSLSTSAVPLAVKVEYAAPSSNAADTTFGYLKGYLSMVWNIYRLFPRDASDYGAASATSDDDDSDGLSNAEEALLGTNAAVADTDGDGDNDLAEVVDISVPADSDCDGKIDAVESSITDSDGDSTNDQSDSDDNDGANADPDGDGTPNSSDDDDDGDGLCDPGIGGDIAGVCTASGDNCPTTANADQANVDSDALGDACDADIDGDDYCNPSACGIVAAQCAQANDNCPSVDNADQTDTDADGAGNACDGDDDNDGVDDGDDNCVLVPNGDQANTDGDINGNACDTDDDDDGIADGDDNCPLVSNGTQEDADDDGVGDACEVSAATPLAGELMINELLADPYPSGGEGYHKCHYLPLSEEEDVLDGDVNCDGVRDANQDEFVEFVNISGKTLDLTGCTINISDDAEPEFEFTEDSSDPSKYIVDDKTAVVIFGGGDPVVSNFAGAKVFASSTEWFLTNSPNGAQVTLTCPDGSGGTTDITSAGYGSNFSDPVIQAGNIDQSLTRATDADAGAALVKHEEATGVISYCVDDTNTPCNASCTCIPAAYTPGTCVNGVRFPDCLN